MTLGQTATTDARRAPAGFDMQTPPQFDLLDAPPPGLLSASRDLEVGVRIAQLHALLDAAALHADPWRRHDLLDQARRELHHLVGWHANRVTVAALEAE
jgi:hypothetical protein